MMNRNAVQREIPGLPPVPPVQTGVTYECGTCGANAAEIMMDAWAEFNPLTQHYELSDTFPIWFCQVCDGQCSPKEIPYYGERTNL